MDKETKYIVIIVIVIGLGLVTAQGFKSLNPLISGYGGMTAEIIDASAQPSDGPNGNNAVIVNLNGTSATVDPVWSGYLLAPDPTKVECEIQGKLNIESKELVGRTNETIDNGDGTYTHKWWEIYDVYLSMGITTRTKAGGGLGRTIDAIFTIKIEENQFNVFDAPDEVIAYVMEVYTLDPIKETNPLKTEGSPTLGGYYFPLEGLGENPVPQWIIDAGYQDKVLKQFSSVSFNIKADYMEPLPGLWTRGETELYWHVGATARVFGYWEDVGTNKKPEPPGGDKPWWAVLFDAVGSLGTAGFTAIIYGVVAIVVIFAAVKIYTSRGD